MKQDKQTIESNPMRRRPGDRSWTRTWIWVLPLAVLAAGAVHAQTFISVPTKTTLWGGTSDFASQGLASMTSPASGVILTGTAISQITGKPVRYLWYGDSSNGLCRMDPEVDAVIPPTIPGGAPSPDGVTGIGGHQNN